MSQNLKIILASGSLARRNLLQKLGVRFEICPSTFEEDMKAYEDPCDLAVFLALGKAKNIALRFTDSVIIGADTFLQVSNEKIGKPSSVLQAKEIFRKMSGKMMEVYTGLAVLKTDSKGMIIRELTDCELTRVWLKSMSKEEIEFLADQKEVLEISGGFSIEGSGGAMVEKIEGSFDNVIGLPLDKLRTILHTFLS